MNMSSAGLLAKTVDIEIEVEGGSSYRWPSAEFPIMSEAKLAAGKMVLQPLGLVLPHYGDCAKIGYVTHGNGIVGITLSGISEERVLKLKKGDLLPIPLGSTTWWFNDGNTEFTVVFLGESSVACNPGNFTYFFLAGTIGIFNGCSTEFLTSVLNLSEEDTTKIIKSQAGVSIVKLNEQQLMPKATENGNEHMVYNTEAELSTVDAKNGRKLIVVTYEELGMLKEVGLSGAIVKLEKNAMSTPQYLPDSAFQVTYIVKGSGRVTIVGINGQNVLDETVQAGELFVVPKFFVVSAKAGVEGMEWFSMFTTQKPVFSQLAGKSSVWTALSPQVVQASLNITPELEECFRSKISMNDTFFPPPN